MSPRFHLHFHFQNVRSYTHTREKRGESFSKRNQSRKKAETTPLQRYSSSSGIPREQCIDTESTKRIETFVVSLRQ